MQIFITGTDTNIGKTIVASWLCTHTKYDYFKPIQTGSAEGTDSAILTRLTNSKVYEEVYVYKEAVSPHLASLYQNQVIDISKIALPRALNLIVEGVGGLMVPINKGHLVIDLIQTLSIPVIIVASARLGTINHTLLSIEALRVRNIEILGIIVNGEDDLHNCQAIEFYGRVSVLARIPFLPLVTSQALHRLPLSQKLKNILDN